MFRTQSTFDPIVGDRILYLILGVLFAVTLPFVTRGLTLVHEAVARGLLGRWPSEALQREVADLSASRGRRSPPRTRRSAVWSATCTTVRSSG